MKQEEVMQQNITMETVVEQLDRGCRKVPTMGIKELLAMDKVAIVDVRSPGEYGEDHIPGAINLPILDNEERALIGTIYKQVGRQEAVDKGLGLTENKLNYFRETFATLKRDHEQVVLYCFRGGMRSQSIAEYIYSLGIPVMRLEGGYKAYRRYVLDFFEKGMEALTFVVLHGHTGAGKTELLWELAKKGYDTLDLEYYAKHSGSVFGDIFFEENQPPQKIFESALFKHLYHTEATYIFMESESPKIGRLFLPQPICRKMERDRHILINCSMQERVKRLVRDYTKLERQKDEMLKSSVNVLRRTLGNQAVDMLEGYISAGNYEALIEYLLRNYYDRFYEFSIDKYDYDNVISADDIPKAVSAIEDQIRQFSTQ